MQILSVKTQMAIYKVTIKKNCIKELRSSEDFILAIQLSRIVNSLRSNFRSYINVSNNDDLLDFKDRIDLLLIHGSMLYEAIHKFSSMSKRLSQLNYWKNNIEQIKELQGENNKKESFTNTVLKSIRNKIFFHFDNEVISEALGDFVLVDNQIFARGRSTKCKDMLYTLVDDLILNHLVQLCPEQMDPCKKYEKIEKKIIELSRKLCSIFDNITKELLGGKLNFIKEN